jgi:hypothetical protein
VYFPGVQAHRRKSLFSVAMPCAIRNERVFPIESEHGIEVQAMLLAVDPVLRFVPFEDHARL